jgi:pimeloyl-ACP methyl ester carboxylesterase
MNRFTFVNTLVIAVLFCIIDPSRTSCQTLFVTSPDSIQIAFEVHGRGSPALIFVHGWSCDRSYWQDQIEPFSRDFKVVSIDLAGHGESGQSRTSWTIEAFGADVAAVVTKLNLQRVILIGHSMGSNVIAEAARRMRPRVAGLVLVDQYNDLGPGLSEEKVLAFAAPLRSNFPDSVASFVRRLFPPTADSALVERVATDMGSAPKAIALDALIFTLNYSRQMPYTLRELRLPVVAINDTRRPTDVASLQRYGVQAMTMPGVGHFLMMENPKGFNQVLRSAIEVIDR